MTSAWTKATWEKLQNMVSNEQAWEVLEAAGAELVKEVIAPIRDAKPFAGDPTQECQCKGLGPHKHYTDEHGDHNVSFWPHQPVEVGEELAVDATVTEPDAEEDRS